MVVLYLGGVDDVNETNLHDEPANYAEERKIKWKAKW